MRALKTGAPLLPRAPAQIGTAFQMIGGSKMNKDIMEGKWKQMRGEAKAWWGKLTDDDLDRAAGKYEVLTGIIQEKYGYTREQAANEIDKRVTEFEDGLKHKTEPTTTTVK
jgi:uncharacterized protein YjbJ (UPF0337 family)